METKTRMGFLGTFVMMAVMMILVVGKWDEIYEGDIDKRASMAEFFGGEVTHEPLRDRAAQDRGQEERLGPEVRHVTELFGHDVDVDFALHDQAQVLDAVATAGLVEVEWYRRGPYPGAEVETERRVGPITVTGDGPLVVREKTHLGSPMTLDQALYEMELVGHDFYLFVDKESERPSVVYRRRAYDYGVISLDLDSEG